MIELFGYWGLGRLRIGGFEIFSISECWGNLGFEVMWVGIFGNMEIYWGILRNLMHFWIFGFRDFGIGDSGNSEIVG